MTTTRTRTLLTTERTGGARGARGARGEETNHSRSNRTDGGKDGGSKKKIYHGVGWKIKTKKIEAGDRS